MDEDLWVQASIQKKDINKDIPLEFWLRTRKQGIEEVEPNTIELFAVWDERHFQEQC